MKLLKQPRQKNARLNEFLALCAWLTLLAFSPSCATPNLYEESTLEQQRQFKPVKLPLLPSTRFRVLQGAFNQHTLSNSGESYSWSLGVPPRTPVCSITDGTVDQIQEFPMAGGCDPKLCDTVSRIRVRHRDGTLAVYKHVKPQVMRGQKVQEGQRIGVTDQSGCLCENKFTFSVYSNESTLPGTKNVSTMPLYFFDLPGGILREGAFEQTPRAGKHRMR